MKRRWAWTAAGLVLLAALLAFSQALLVPKYQRGIIEGSMTAEYYANAHKNDVLWVGDCELYENISPIALWREYGIPSYIRGSAQQLIWQSYYLLEDALRYETPKVVVFNVLACKYNVPQSEAYNRMSLDGMRWSMAKVKAVRTSMLKDEHFIEYVFPLLRYHDRWSQLEEQDGQFLFHREQVSHSGYYMRADVRPQTGFPPVMPLADYTLGDTVMGYLAKMADLCREKGISLVLIKAPTEYPHWYDQWDSQIADFAQENGIAYINCIPLQEEIGLDMQLDTYDGGLHLNVFGAEKLACYLGNWLRQEYTLPDRRDDATYSTIWAEKCARYDAERGKQLAEIAEYGTLQSVGTAALQ